MVMSASELWSRPRNVCVVWELGSRALPWRLAPIGAKYAALPAAKVVGRSSGFGREVCRPAEFEVSFNEAMHRSEHNRRQDGAGFRAYFDGAADALFVHDEAGHIVDVNREACESLGYARHELIGKSLRDVDANGAVHGSFAQGGGSWADAGEMRCFETSHRRKDGSVFPVEVRVRPFSQDGRRLAMWSARDFTKHRQHKIAGPELPEREQELCELIESIPAIAWTICSDGSDAFASKRWREYTGLSAEALSGSAWLDVIHQHDLSGHNAKWRDCVARGVPFENEARIRRADGQYRWFLLRAVPLSDRGGRVVKWYALATDIEDRKRAEQALRASEERFRTLVQFSFDVYWETDAQHRFTTQEFGEHVKDPPVRGSELGKTRWEVLYLEPGEKAWRKHLEPLDAHLPFRDFELARPTGDGGRRYVSVSGFPVFDDMGAFIGYRGVGRHITDRKRAEEEHRAPLWFLESMDLINRAIQGANDLDHLMSDVLQAALQIFACDRAWLVYPCDSDAPSGHAVMERTRPEYLGALARRTKFPIDPHVAAVFAAALAAPGAVLTGFGHSLEIPPRIAEQFAIRSQIAMAIDAKTDKPNLFVLHQCSLERDWTAQEQRLFQEVGRRFGDALTSLTTLRSLRDSEQKLQVAQQIAHVGWWQRDLTTTRVSLSDEVQRIFGVQPVDLPQWQERWVNLIHPDDRAKTAAAAAAALSGGPRYDVEYRVIRPDGTVRVVHSQGDVTWDESGRPVRQFGVLQDITELRRVEEALRESEQRYRMVFEKANDAIFLESESDDIVEVNERACTLLGYSRDELLKMKVPDLQAPEVRRSAGRAIRKEMEKHRSAAFEAIELHRSGRRIPVEVTNTRISDRGRNLVLSVVRDITERVRAQDELRAREARFRTFVDHARDAFFLIDENLIVIDVNRQACESLGYNRKELIGMQPRDFDAGLDDASIARLTERAAASETLTFETLHRRKDGTVFPVEIRSHRFEQGGKGFYLALVRDITERKRAEEELRATELSYRMLVDFAADAVMTHAEDGKVIDVNRQACENLSYTREELIGMMPADFDADLDREQLRRVAERVGAGETLTIDTHHRRKDGTVLPVEVRLRQVRKGDRWVTISLSRDISERKRGEEERERLRRLKADLARMSRVITMGELTASIAHEVNQPLAAMVVNAAACERWLAAKPPQTAKARNALKSIGDDGRRASAFIGRIHSLMKRHPPRKEPVDINEAIREVLALAQRQLRSNDVTLRLGKELSPAHGATVQMQQVLLNLIANAVDAMKGIDDRRRELTIVSRQDGDQVVVEVRDSGIGLDGERAERLFEAFYTTKEDGMGIGLAIRRSVVEGAGGRLWAGPNQPHGAVFEFSLPVAGQGQA